MKGTLQFVTFVLITFTCSLLYAENPVNFVDQNLKTAVETALGITDPTPTDMLGLRNLYAGNKGITNLTGIEYAANLTKLYLSYNQITDISALSGLTNLTSLDLVSTQIVDISSLSGLTNLTWLGLGWNQIVDISSLSGLTNLTGLNLGYNQIADISALSGLTNLKTLFLADNQIDDISALSGLTNLKSLGLGFNQIVNISALSGLTNLTYLGLYNNQIVDISVLSGLTNLTGLNLAYNQIIDISALSGLTNLPWLSLGYNQITDISALSSLTNLQWLYLFNNQLSDISALSGLTNLTELYLGDNQISDISVLSGLTNLTSLHLVSNQISDISVLSSFTNLSWLSLNSNPLSCQAYDVYMPMIQGNNPGMELYIDPRPEYCNSSINNPPVANAGPDQTVYAWIDGIADVNLDGSGSYDGDNQPLTYKWRWTIDGNDYEANGVRSMIELPVGQHTISLVVNDGRVDAAADEVKITVIGAIEGKLCVTPKALNSKSFMPKIMATLWLPKEITKEQIDLGKPVLIYPGEIEAEQMWIGRDFNFKSKEWDKMLGVSFDKDELIKAVDVSVTVELAVVGQLKTGQYFYGTDDMNVINPGNWLNGSMRNGTKSAVNNVRQ